MVSAVQDLIDPDFDPLTAILDDEPRFLKPLPARISPEDLEFLRFRGAVSIPESGLRDELLRCYIQWVHSFMPVLNLQEFLRCVAENDPEGNVSILLFQAVMFVGTAFVDLKHLQDAGYSTRKSARNAFYTRLRLLYSLDCEEDRIVILQTLLLMTYWADSENSPQRDIWDWIGVCNTQAQSIGLNKDPASDEIDIRTQRLRSRLWWCLYSRDRLIAMGMRRPLQVNDGTSSVPMLRMDDFDFEPFSPYVVAKFCCRQLQDVSHQKRLATLFIEKVKLCQCIGRVLFAQYTPSQCRFGATDRTTVTLIPRQASESEFARCGQKLDSWLSALPKDAQFIPKSGNTFYEGENVLLLHGAMLRMLYHATSSALHRPRATALKDQSKSRTDWRNAARTKMNDAAAGITHIIQGLNQLNLTRFLPQSGVTVILPAAVAHLTNTMSEDPAVRESSVDNFHRCIQGLHCLKDIYPAASQEFANIEAAIKMQAGASSTFFQVMEYNLNAPATSLATRKPSNVNSIFQPQAHLPAVTKISKPQAQTSSAQGNIHHIKPSVETTHEPAPPLFPNDFDFDSDLGIIDNNPFNFMSIDIDSFRDIQTPPNPNNNQDKPYISPPPQDQDTVDWAQELFQDTDLNQYSNTETFRMPEKATPPLDQDQNNHDAFCLTLNDTDDFHPMHFRHQSMNDARPEITGDLDRDLGFESGDDMF
ncbi:transcriptional regulator family: Fungal Specific TF [Penicillium roqueforti]|nr:transcriptional regulator family: Fungal Specific TF [Penicillium roqueforti]KAI2736150.1 transcriptional regulator family: Fungal Specific TF [Penicillium roqueforti]KAI2738947.1 transcriptional regulator family: Fungal Specific TF [Penicillium roqueforti]KAI2768141.1 transcriptional regulator family: Fungal Specific TF [Penicillium roqueforti]KAI3063497.1 transcriptional regulator family: Fungal Specific TF [Penicillium roqueforti]